MRTLIDELMEMEIAPTVHSCGCKHSADRSQRFHVRLQDEEFPSPANLAQERAAVQAAIAAGNRNENRLSDLIFFRRHPERNGRLIQRNEPNFHSLSQEWLRIRDQIVRPELRGGHRPSYTPPDPQTSCAVPQKQRSVSSEMEMFDPINFETSTARPNARLCLYQNANNSSHRNHFSCQATRWARAIRAIAASTASPCRPGVGQSSYNTGAEIISAIQSSNTCLGLPLEVVHIFGHSGTYGFFGTDPLGAVGLYYTPVDPTSRGNGGRTVSDIPTSALSNNVVFYLHGCSTAEGTNNFAKALYQHLAASLTNPTVFGHYNGGCAGRDNSWKRYSSISPNGSLLRGGILGGFGVRNCCS